jgi:probable rRNA maturation factor
MIDITVTLRRATSKAVARRISYKEIAESILGKDYELSLVICGDELATRMNIEYRKKAYSPNVLSFPLDNANGEIFLNVRCAERESKRYGIPEQERLTYLYIHGCFHLKGLDHGEVMEREEKRIMKRFGF